VVTDRRPPERPVSPYLRAATLILALLPVMILRPAETPAEVRTTVRIDATNSLIFGGAEPLSAGLATAELDLEALGNRDVRSRFQLRSTLLENAPAATASNPTAATVITVPRGGDTLENGRRGLHRSVHRGTNAADLGRRTTVQRR
jgi:hypothetical protein